MIDGLPHTESANRLLFTLSVWDTTFREID